MNHHTDLGAHAAFILHAEPHHGSAFPTFAPVAPRATNDYITTVHPALFNLHELLYSVHDHYQHTFVFAFTFGCSMVLCLPVEHWFYASVITPALPLYVPRSFTFIHASDTALFYVTGRFTTLFACFDTRDSGFPRTEPLVPHTYTTPHSRATTFTHDLRGLGWLPYTRAHTPHLPRSLFPGSRDTLYVGSRCYSSWLFVVCCVLRSLLFGRCLLLLLYLIATPHTLPCSFFRTILPVIRTDRWLICRSLSPYRWMTCCRIVPFPLLRPYHCPRSVFLSLIQIGLV